MLSGSSRAWRPLWSIWQNQREVQRSEASDLQFACRCERKENEDGVQVEDWAPYWQSWRAVFAARPLLWLLWTVLTWDLWFWWQSVIRNILEDVVYSFQPHEVSSSNKSQCLRGLLALQAVDQRDGRLSESSGGAALAASPTSTVTVPWQKLLLGREGSEPYQVTRLDTGHNR